MHVLFNFSNCRKQKRIHPSVSLNNRNTQKDSNPDVTLQQVVRMISKSLLRLIFYPFLHIFYHIRLLIDNDGKYQQLGEELSLIFITTEAPLQIMLTLWLILRGLVLFPLDSDDMRAVSWSSDRRATVF